MNLRGLLIFCVVALTTTASAQTNNKNLTGQMRYGPGIKECLAGSPDYLKFSLIWQPDTRKVTIYYRDSFIGSEPLRKAGKFRIVDRGFGGGTRGYLLFFDGIYRGQSAQGTWAMDAPGRKCRGRFTA